MKRSMTVSILIVILYGSFSFSAKAETLVLPGDTSLTVQDTVFIRIAEDEKSIEALQPNGDEKTRKKFIAALFAFPFPLGFMGAHRVMLGTKPWVPVVYVATFGGCFGVLPLIDFLVITFSKDITPYENNPNIFMWMK